MLFKRAFLSLLLFTQMEKGLNFIINLFDNKLCALISLELKVHQNNEQKKLRCMFSSELSNMNPHLNPAPSQTNCQNDQDERKLGSSRHLRPLKNPKESTNNTSLIESKKS
jgi:hypothetical protein